MTQALRILKRYPASSAIAAVTLFATAFVLLMPGLHDPAVTASFTAVIALSVAGIVMDPRPYSLCQFFCLFCLVFMGVAPLCLYTTGYVAWNIMPFGNSEYLRANALIFFCLLTFITCAYYRRPRIQTPLREQHRSLPGSARSDLYLIILSGLATAVILWYYRHNLTFLIRRYDGLVNHNTPQTGSLIINGLIRAIPPICLTVCLMQRRRSWRAIILTAIFTLTASFPTSIPRYQLATLFMPLCIILIPLMRRSKVLSLGILLLFATVFPLLNLSRAHPYSASHTIIGVDFDAYQNLLALMRIDLVTYGKQLLGVLLFFVPRAVWPGKPVGSGFEIASELNISFPNISMPVFGEGYINFGIPGAIIFTVAVALIFRRLDSGYDFRSMSLSTLLYLILLGESIFLLRGALMPAFAALCGFSVAAIIVYLPARALGKDRDKPRTDNDP